MGMPNFYSRQGSNSTNIIQVGRKRRADDDEDFEMQHRQRTPFSNASQDDDHMRTSASPEPTSRIIKRARVNITGRALPLSRIMEPMDSSSLKQLIQNLCDRHPELLSEVQQLAPRPTVQSALETLKTYESNVKSSFPYGGNSTGDYAFNRVKPALMELLDALLDYTQHFLPPQESQPSTSLAFLDGATQIIHQLPEWSSEINNRHKQNAYEEITKAWVLVIGEAAKKGAGIAMQYGGWDLKLIRHNEVSGGRMQLALTEMGSAIMGASVENSPKPKKFGFGTLPSGVAVPVKSW